MNFLSRAWTLGGLQKIVTSIETEAKELNTYIQSGNPSRQELIRRVNYIKSLNEKLFHDSEKLRQDEPMSGISNVFRMFGRDMSIVGIVGCTNDFLRSVIVDFDLE